MRMELLDSKNHTRRARAIILGLVLVLFFTFACRRPRRVMLRYKYQPGTVLNYEVFLRGEGKVKMSPVGSDDRKKELEFPLRLTGSLNLIMAVTGVSPDGLADLELSYRDFDFEVINEVRDRELKILLNEDGMEIWEGETLLKENQPDSDDFPLKELAGKRFLMQIDRRGKIQKLQATPSLPPAFAELNLKEMLKQAQPEFPEGALRVGDSWSREIELRLPRLPGRWASGERWKLQVTSTCESFQESEGQPAFVISLEGKIEQLKEDEEGGKRSDFGIKKVVQKISGMMLFDPEAGELLSSRISLDQQLDGVMEFAEMMSGGGFDIKLNFNLDFNMNLKEKSGRRE